MGTENRRTTKQSNWRNILPLVPFLAVLAIGRKVSRPLAEKQPPSDPSRRWSRYGLAATVLFFGCAIGSGIGVVLVSRTPRVPAIGDCAEGAFFATESSAENSVQINTHLTLVDNQSAVIIDVSGASPPDSSVQSRFLAIFTGGLNALGEDQELLEPLPDSSSWSEVDVVGFEPKTARAAVGTFDGTNHRYLLTLPHNCRPQDALRGIVRMPTTGIIESSTRSMDEILVGDQETRTQFGDPTFWRSKRVLLASIDGGRVPTFADLRTSTANSTSADGLQWKLDTALTKATRLTPQWAWQRSEAIADDKQRRGIWQGIGTAFAASFLVAAIQTLVASRLE